MVSRVTLGVFVFLIAAGTVAVQGNLPSPYPMPGTIVSRPSLAPVGTRLPNAAPRVGTPVGYTGPDGQPINVGQRPAGQLVNLNNLSAPLIAPLPTELTGAKPKSSLEQLFDKWRSTFGFGPPAVQPPANWTPGLSRRNRDRKDAATAWQRN